MKAYTVVIDTNHGEFKVSFFLGTEEKSSFVGYSLSNAFEIATRELIRKDFPTQEDKQ